MSGYFSSAKRALKGKSTSTLASLVVAGLTAIVGATYVVAKLTDAARGKNESKSVTRFEIEFELHETDELDFSGMYYKQQLLNGESGGNGDGDGKNHKKNDNAKVIHFIRHGEGIHNVAERTNGRAVWEKELVFDQKFRDPGLTEVGEAQCTKTGDKVAAAVVADKMRVPTLVISSPFYRTLLTAVLAVPFQATKEACRVVVELFRETNGRHQCDRRNEISSRVAEFPNFDFSLDYDLDDQEFKALHTSSTSTAQCGDHAAIDAGHFPSSSSKHEKWLSYSNSDVSFSETERESVEERNVRAVAFMRWLWNHPAKEVVLVGHSGIILSSINALKNGNGKKESDYLKNGEVRSFLVRSA
jgi:broad specificity phosphatase PhoE